MGSFLIVKGNSVNMIDQLFIGLECPYRHYDEESKEDKEGAKGEYVDSGNFFEIVYKFHGTLF